MKKKGKKTGLQSIILWIIVNIKEHLIESIHSS